MQYYNTLFSIICPLVAYERLKAEENFKLLALKVTMVLKRGGCLQEVQNIVIWLGKFWYFRKLVIEEKCLPTGGGDN